MSTKIVAEPGFYDGKYRKAGSHVLDFDTMSKDQLLVEARKRNLPVTARTSEADLRAALAPAPEADA